MRLSDKAQASLDKVLAKFEDGDLSDIAMVARFHIPDNAPAAKWSINNRVLAYAQTGNLDCRTYRQWQAVGRQVIAKGAAYIFAPRTYTVEHDDGTIEQRLAGWKAIPVFAYTKTEGDAIEEYTPKEVPPLADLAKRFGIEVDYLPLPASFNGDCTTDGSQIRLGTADERTWFHELAHALHARVDKLTGGQVPEQETVAEFTSCVLMELYGLRDTTGAAWRYISHYNPDNPIKAIRDCLDTVDKVLALIFS